MPLFLRITGLDEPFKKQLLSNIFENNEQKISLDQIDIGLGKFIISGISFKSADQKFEILIDELILDFNIIDFLKTPTAPKNSLTEVYLNNPQLIISRESDNLTINNSGSNEKELLTVINELNGFRNLRIHNGQILYKTKKGDLLRYLENLNGWVNSQSSEEISINATGSSYNSKEENIVVNLKLDNETDFYRTSVRIIDIDLDHPSLKNITDKFQLFGRANGYLSITGNTANADSLLINGELQLKDVHLLSEENEINNFNVDLIIKNNSMATNNGSFEYKNHTVEISILLSDLFNPVASGTIHANSLPVKDMSEFFETSIFNGSIINLDIAYMFDGSNYSLNGSANSNNFSFYKSNFNSFSSSFSANNDGININSFNLINNELKLAGRANYRRDTNYWKLFLNGNYYSGEHILFNYLTEAEHKFDLNLVYNAKTSNSIGTWNYMLAGEDTLLNTHGVISSDSTLTKMELVRSNYPNLQARVSLFDLYNMPHIDNLELINFPYHIFSSEKVIAGFNDLVNSKVSLKGGLNNLRGQITLNHASNSELFMLINADIKNLLKEDKSFSGTIDFKNLSGSFKAQFNPTQLASHFSFNEGIDGEIIVDLSEKNDQLKGKINFTDFKILQLFEDNNINGYGKEGEINGNITLFGDLISPGLKGEFTGNKFVINEIGYYQPQISFDLNRSTLNVNKIKIFHNNNEITGGYLNWDFKTNELNGTLKGDSLDLTTLFKTLSQPETYLSGMADYQSIISGTMHEPVINASFQLKNGLIDSINYDNLNFKIVDKLIDGGSWFDFESHNLELQVLNIFSQGHYHINSSGSLPFSAGGAIDYTLNFDGDIFSLIPHWEPFFKDGASLTDIKLKIGGSRENPRLLFFDAVIDRGELWLADVAPHIENLSGHIHLKEGSNKIDMDLTAYVEKNYLKINTVRDIKTSSGRKLDHWYFKGIDLDFGILQMETSTDGVNLHIPGLMPVGESGKIHLAGKTSEEKFYFAGPVKHPLGYGLVTLNDAFITYPFIVKENTNPQKSTAVIFLSNMEWDATLKAGEDVIFFRDIPAYFDNVYTELAVDEKSQGIEFKGIINEGTFKPVGNLVSTRGRLEYLDLTFRVERFAVDLLKNRDLPDVSGRAWTTLRDSVGAVPKTIYLQLYAINAETGQIQQSGNWTDFKFKLVSADPEIGETQEQVLSYLGYSVENIGEKATNVGGALTDKYLIRPLLRPFEKVLERNLGMDLVRFNSSIARNLFYSSVGRQLGNQKSNPFINPYSSEVPYLYLMSSSEVTVGKYLNENLYLTYTGQLVSVYETSETGYDMNHSLGLEYRFYKNILLEFEWDRELLGYYNLENQRQYLNDFKIKFRHSFSF